MGWRQDLKSVKDIKMDTTAHEPIEITKEQGRWFWADAICDMAPEELETQ